MPKLMYFKRYRMERDLCHLPIEVQLPSGYIWQPWHDSLIDTHAHVKLLSFENHIDSLVFPNLGHLAGCRDLMRAIRCRPGFCTAATWLIRTSSITPETPAHGYVGTVQGLIDNRGWGAIQNLGVVPDHRAKGLGRALLMQALVGFAQVGANRALLEVTAHNESAIRMYRGVGFRCTKTIYKSVDVPGPSVVGAGV